MRGGSALPSPTWANLLLPLALASAAAWAPAAIENEGAEAVSEDALKLCCELNAPMPLPMSYEEASREATLNMEPSRDNMEPPEKEGARLPPPPA